MKTLDCETVRQRINNVYRRNKQTLARLEKKHLESPTSALSMQISELQGVLLGLKKALTCLELHANDNEFPFDQATA